jgi:hypothetical protein
MTWRSDIRVFYAHSSAESEEETKSQCQKIKELISKRGESKGRELSVSVVPGRADFRANCRGDWDVWAKGIITRDHAITREPFYDLIIVPGEYVGRATAQIVDSAVRAGRPVFLLTEGGEEWGPLQRITQVYPYDPDDWQGGYRCEPDPQLSLPFQEKSHEAKE